MNKPENTSLRSAADHLIGTMSKGPSEYVTSMESAGQRQLVNSSVLPIDGPWAELEQLGFKRDEVVDDLFVNAILPEGWSREGADHAMWSYVVDERGIRRVAVFYKAAFYDRRADMHLVNPGRAAATAVLYGNGPVSLPENWERFTPDERASFIVALDDMDKKIAESPEVYGKYMARLESARVLLG